MLLSWINKINYHWKKRKFGLIPIHEPLVWPQTNYFIDFHNYKKKPHFSNKIQFERYKIFLHKNQIFVQSYSFLYKELLCYEETETKVFHFKRKSLFFTYIRKMYKRLSKPLESVCLTRVFLFFFVGQISAYSRLIKNKCFYY